MGNKSYYKSSSIHRVTRTPGHILTLLIKIRMDLGYISWGFSFGLYSLAQPMGYIGNLIFEAAMQYGSYNIQLNPDSSAAS